MGMRYSAGVFFGACVPRDSTIGLRLSDYVERHGGTPAPTEVREAMVGEVGCFPTGDTWLTVEALGSSRRFSRDEDTPEPEPLTEDPSWRPALLGFLAMVGAPDLPVGWHFQGTVI